ncbi:hypothetical protein [Streptococcus suis]
MITDQDYNNLSENVYNVDALKNQDKPFVVGDPVGDDKFVIIKPPVDAGNGMQAMEVAPIKGYDSDNKSIPDTTQVVIASFPYPDSSVNTEYL